MRRRKLLPLVLLLALAACGGDKGPRVVIEGAGGETVVDVEVADTRKERARGLMGRESLPSDAGMVFVFPNERSGAFWMKDTLIPLSIAFYDRDGTILRILDMEPCRRDPPVRAVGDDLAVGCTLYDPGVSYRGALEVNQGAFERWGVSEGDVIRLEFE